MRHPHFDAATGGLDRDEATGFSLLDCGASVIRVRAANSIGSPTASTSMHVTDRRGQVTDARFDELDQAGRHDRITDPPPVAALLHNSAVGDLLLDDVLQIQNIAACQLPQPLSGIRIHRSLQRRRQQSGRFVQRQLL